MELKTFSPQIYNGNVDKTIKELHGAYFDLQDTLKHMLRNLDEENVVKAKSVVADWVYAGHLSADQITSGKIVADQIDATDLHVSSANITGRLTADQIDATYLHVNSANIDGALHLSVGSVIDWNYVTAPSYSNIQGTKPPSNADNTYSAIGSNRLTYIDGSGIYTGTLSADQIIAGTISANKISGGTLSGVNIYAGKTLYISNDYLAGIKWQGTTQEIYIDPGGGAMTLAATYLKHEDDQGVWQLCKCGGGQSLKIQYWAGHLEVFDGTTYIGRCAFV